MKMCKCNRCEKSIVPFELLINVSVVIDATMSIISFWVNQSNQLKQLQLTLLEIGKILTVSVTRKWMINNIEIDVCDINKSMWPLSIVFTVINRNRRSNGGITGSSQQLNAQQQPQQTGPQQQQSVNMQVNSIKQVNKVKPNVNRQPPDNAVSPSTYNR